MRGPLSARTSFGPFWKAPAPQARKARLVRCPFLRPACALGPLTSRVAPAALPTAFFHAAAVAEHRSEQGTVPWYDAPRVVRARVSDCPDAGPLYRMLLPGPCSVVVVDPDGFHPAECGLLGDAMRHAPPEVEFAVFSPESASGDAPPPAARTWELHTLAADRAGQPSLGETSGAAFLRQALDRRAGAAGDAWTQVDVHGRQAVGRGVVLDTEADEVDWIAQHVHRLLDEGACRGCGPSALPRSHDLRPRRQPARRGSPDAAVCGRGPRRGRVK